MSLISSFSRTDGRWAWLEALTRPQRLHLAGIAGLHLVALGSLYFTEFGPFGIVLAVLSWALLNFFWLALLRRPGMAAALSLALLEILIVVSRFKFDITWMTVSFFDLLIIDPDTIAFLLAIFPSLRTGLLVVAILGVPVLILIWRFDAFRMRRLNASLGLSACLAGIIGMSVAVPEEPWEPFQGVNHFSNFARSGVMSISALAFHGWFESDASVAGRLKTLAGASCRPAVKPPHIVMVLDESSFDISAAPGIKVPAHYSSHFSSFDGKNRSLLVESTGGPTWYAEYNVLTGLSARSYGRLMFYVTRIAAGHVERGLPQALRRCGYKTFTLYPTYGAFLSARRFQKTAGVQHFIDSDEMRATDVEPDHFFYDQALRLIERERDGAPLFIFAYTVANHFPWDNTFRPDLTPGWRPLGNDREVDEYIRRQTMSAQDYSEFRARLARQFPGDSFLIVRFGDHQPNISSKILEPALDRAAIANRIMTFDPLYFTTYYALDAVNFQPADLSSALDTLEASYLPLVLQEAAGLPLDPSFVEQKDILRRCQGLFYRCHGGSEARRFNRLLIDAGLIKGF